MEPYVIDRDSDSPLYIQIRDAIIKKISNGELKIGDKLAPVATLSREIGVTQATIRRALKDLSNAGHTQCHVGRGTFICDAESKKRETKTEKKQQQLTPPQASTLPEHPVNPVKFAARRLRSGASKALVDIMPLAARDDIIQFTQGIPDPRLLADNFLERMSEETMRNGSSKFLQATETLGSYELREEIAIRFNEEGNYITPDQVLITNGASQAITLLAESAIEHRPEIFCETPCFQGIPDTFTAMGQWVESIGRDEQGPIVEELYRHNSARKKFLYLCPYSHNPTGVSLSQERAAELAEWARKTSSVLVTDEIFKDLNHSGSPPSSIFREVGDEYSVTIGSLSKSVMPGFRIGWMISSAERINKLGQLKRLMDHSSPSFMQGIALSIFKSGEFDRHNENMRTIYRERIETMRDTLTKFMPSEITWSNPDGGFSLMLELPKGYSSIALLLQAIDKGVSFLPGPLFDIDQRFVHALRLSCAWTDKNQIREGIELLSSAVEELLSLPQRDSGLSGLGSFQ